MTEPTEEDTIEVGLAARTLDVTLAGRFVFGAGVVSRLPGAVRDLGGERALVVTDRGLVAAGLAPRVAAALASGGLDVATFDGVEPNPTTATVRSGAAALAALGSGPGAVVVALGGGSAMDAAKGVALAAANPGIPVTELDYRNASLAPGLPLVAIPTTAGTGSETNSFGVITNEAEGRKFYVGNESCRPRLALLDPELTLALPAAATAATGIDALSHALEGLMSKHANPLSMAIALEVIAMIGGSLERAVDDGADIEARSTMLLSAHLAGIAQGMTGLGLAHAIAHPLGGRLNVPHGAALAAVLPAVMAWNRDVVAGRLARAATALGASGGRSPARAADTAIDRIAGLIRAVGMTRRLGDFGVTPGLAGTIADDAVADPVINNTPRMPSRDEVREMILVLA